MTPGHGFGTEVAYPANRPRSQHGQRNRSGQFPGPLSGPLSGPGIAATSLRSAERACLAKGGRPAWPSATAIATASAGVKLSGGSDMALSSA